MKQLPRKLMGSIIAGAAAGTVIGYGATLRVSPYLLGLAAAGIVGWLVYRNWGRLVRP